MRIFVLNTIIPNDDGDYPDWDDILQTVPTMALKAETLKAFVNTQAGYEVTWEPANNGEFAKFQDESGTWEHFWLTSTQTLD